MGANCRVAVLSFSIISISNNPNSQPRLNSHFLPRQWNQHDCNLHDFQYFSFFLLCFLNIWRKSVPEKIGAFEVSHFTIVTFLFSCCCGGGEEITKKIWVKLSSKDSFYSFYRGDHWEKDIFPFKALNSCEQCVIFLEKRGGRREVYCDANTSFSSFNSTKKRFAFHFSHRYFFGENLGRKILLENAFFDSW